MEYTLYNSQLKADNRIAIVTPNIELQAIQFHSCRQHCSFSELCKKMDVFYESKFSMVKYVANSLFNGLCGIFSEMGVTVWFIIMVCYGIRLNVLGEHPGVIYDFRPVRHPVLWLICQQSRQQMLQF